MAKKKSGPEGRTIVATRQMTPVEAADEGWDRGTIALVLDDGSILYPSRDHEGNGPGALFGRDKQGQTVAFR